MSAVHPEKKCPDIRPAARRSRLALAIVIAAAARIGAQSRPESAPARAGTIIGQVLMPDGKPAMGATVKIFRPRLPSLPPALSAVLPEADHDEEYRVTCDGNGSFTAPARPGELHGLLATDGGELMSAFVNWLCAGDSTVLRLGPTRMIEGTVVVLEQGKASLTVQALPARGGRWASQPIGGTVGDGVELVLATQR